jgi:hypothetical protein
VFTPRVSRRAATAAGCALVAALVAGCGSSSSSSPPTPSASAPASPSPSASSSETSTAQHLSVTPDSGLTSGQKVRYTASGFKADDMLAVSECIDHGVHTSASDCNVLGTTSANGSGTAAGTATVVSHPVGSVDATCGSPTPCLLSVSELSTTGLSATEDFSFAS